MGNSTKDVVSGHGGGVHSGAEGQEGRIEASHRAVGPDQPQKGRRRRLQRLFEIGYHQGIGVGHLERGSVGAEIQNRPAAQTQEGRLQKEEQFLKEEDRQKDCHQEEDKLQKEGIQQEEEWLQKEDRVKEKDRLKEEDLL